MNAVEQLEDDQEQTSTDEDEIMALVDFHILFVCLFI